MNRPLDSTTNIQSPTDLNLPFESFFITIEDNVRINVVFIKQKESEDCPTIIYFHGNSGNVGHRLQHVSDLYHNIGCNVLCVEYRGFGRSEGRPTERGVCLDAQAGLNYLLRQPDINKDKIFVLGRSLGGAVAIDLVAKSPNRARIRALIVENTFTTLPNIARKLFPILLSLPDWSFKNQFRSIEKVRNIRVPVLFISGLSDEIVPPMMMASFFRQCASTNSAAIRTRSLSLVRVLAVGECPHTSYRKSRADCSRGPLSRVGHWCSTRLNFSTQEKKRLSRLKLWPGFSTARMPTKIWFGV